MSTDKEIILVIWRQDAICDLRRLHIQAGTKKLNLALAYQKLTDVFEPSGSVVKYPDGKECELWTTSGNPFPL